MFHPDREAVIKARRPKTRQLPPDVLDVFIEVEEELLGRVAKEVAMNEKELSKEPLALGEQLWLGVRKPRKKAS